MTLTVDSLPSFSDTPDVDHLLTTPPDSAMGYRITDADAIGEGSLAAKARGNVAAIRVIKDCESSGRQPTAQELRTLVRYVGWGGLSTAFDPTHDDYRQQYAELKELLTAEEYDSARHSTLNAHYTARHVIDAMWSAVRHMGFTGGRVLEPACGLGHFIGLMPDDLRGASTVTAVELDPITARIAKALYPGCDIRIGPYQDQAIPAGFYDLAISNVPFGDYTVNDKRQPNWSYVIHDYFFLKALTHVRPGGMVAFITSAYTLDKSDSSVRQMLHGKAELVAALRLPNTAFKRNANTEVTTDILFLRKRTTSEEPGPAGWLESLDMSPDINQQLLVNEYYHTRPEHMMGTMQLVGKMYAKGTPTCVPHEHPPLTEQLATAIATLPTSILTPAPQHNKDTGSRPSTATIAPDEVKDGAYCVINGMAGRKAGSVFEPIAAACSEKGNRISSFITVRHAVRACLAAQLGTDESAVLTTRAALNTAYDQFVDHHGFLNSRNNRGFFKSDPDFFLVSALENYNSDTKTATKASIFTERTIANPRTLDVRTPQDALMVSLAERATVDMPLMSHLLGKPEGEIITALGDMLFRDPLTRSWLSADEYLSGNVREKLEVAETAALSEPEYQRNAEALRAVQPPPLAPSEIDARLGSIWIPPDDIAAFAQELLGDSDIDVSYTQALGAWFVDGGYTAKFGVAARSEFGTEHRNALSLIEDALNLRVPTVTFTDDEGKTHTNVKATEAARDKQQTIKDRFRTWIWDDPARAVRLAEKYNREFNSTRQRSFNGDHLTLAGSSPTITLRPHQRSSVWRILQTPNCVLAHVVGAGKTYTMVAAAMELRRLGLARKPMIVVPNHMLIQFSREMLQLYPAAHVLIATEDDMAKANRQRLFSRIATGNWDAVIVTHSGFEKIPLSPERVSGFLRQQIKLLEDAMWDVEGNRTTTRSGRGIVKAIEAAKERLELKLEKLVAEGKKDNLLTFENLGVDRLFVDEAHLFKNLHYVTKMTRVAGLPTAHSQRAFDMFLKCRYIQSVNDGAGVVFATGTPIANSVAEMYTIMRYLMLDELKERGLDHFDAWAATFGEPVTAMELAPDGSGFRTNTRFARFINVPELMNLFRTVADIQTADMLKLPTPPLHTGSPIVLQAPCSAHLKAITDSLVERAQDIKNGSVEPWQDNMLKITSEGRKAALDIRLIASELPDHADSKVAHAAKVIASIHHRTAADRLTQLVFCDLSTPTTTFNVYDDLRDKLVRLGIPGEEIAYIHDAKTNAAKAALFTKVRSGEIRVLMGSTSKMGMGTNVQKRLIALHDLDAPWRPADIEQRAGRIQRQGNECLEIFIYRYVTASSFDAYMWQCLETKAKFIGQVMSGESHARRIEDLDNPPLSYSEIKAIASGNPLVLERAKIDAEVNRLARLKTIYIDQKHRLANEIWSTQSIINHMEQDIPLLKEDGQRYQDTRGDKFAITLLGEVYTERKEAGAILEQIYLYFPGKNTTTITIGHFAGFELRLQRSVIILDGGRDRRYEFSFYLVGRKAYEVRATKDSYGTILSLTHMSDYPIRRLHTIEARELPEARQRLAQLNAQHDRPWEHTEAYHRAEARRDEIMAQLDLTKNAAATVADTDASNDKPSETATKLKEAASEGDDATEVDVERDTDDSAMAIPCSSAIDFSVVVDTAVHQAPDLSAVPLPIIGTRLPATSLQAIAAPEPSPVPVKAVSPLPRRDSILPVVTPVTTSSAVKPSPPTPPTPEAKPAPAPTTTTKPVFRRPWGHTAAPAAIITTPGPAAPPTPPATPIRRLWQGTTTTPSTPTKTVSTAPSTIPNRWKGKSAPAPGQIHLL